jgi:hypothetical protein
MSNSTVNLALYPYGQGGREVVLPVDGGAHIYAGTLVSQLTGTGMLVAGSTASTGPAVGVALHEVDNTAGSDGDLRCKVMTGKIFLFANGTSTDACSEATLMGSPVYMFDDHTVYDNSAGSTLKAAGRFVGMEPDGKVRVFVGMGAVGDLPVADAADIAIADAGAYTSAAEVEAALQELYLDANTANASFSVPLTGWLDADGDPLVKFVTGDVGTVGYNLADSEALNLRWNNYPSNPGVTAICQFALPADLDAGADIVLQFLCSKSGATVGDATKITYAAYLIAEGDLHDADTVVTGDTAALVGDAIAKTTDILSATIGAADVPAGAVSMTLKIFPKSGTIETDDFMIHAVRVKYTRARQTS